MQVPLENIDSLAWEKMDNLLPAIVQDALSGFAHLNIEIVLCFDNPQTAEFLTTL